MLGKKFAVFFSFLIILGWNVPSSAEDKEGEPEAPIVGKIYEAIPYYQGADAVPERHVVDIVLPKEEAWATLFWIPGGAWAAGSRKQELPVAKQFAEKGVAVVIVDHRMSAGRWMTPKLPETGVSHPAHIIDVARAFSFMHREAEKYGLDNTKFFVSGFSAGGHLSALLAMDEKYLKQEGLDSSAIVAAIPVSGTYDIEHYYQAIFEGMGEDIARDHVIGVFGSKDNFVEASPATYLEDLSIPVLIVSDGSLMLYTDRFREIVDGSSKGDLIEFVDYDNETHNSLFFRLAGQNKTNEPRDEIVAFMKKQLK